MSRQPRQIVMEFRTWGGRCAGAGRKPKGARAMLPHDPRPALAARFPVHVTLKVRAEVRSLRTKDKARCIRRAFAAAAREGFRITDWSIQGDHIHLMVEAQHTQALSRGVQGFSIRVAKGLNRLLGRKGSVFVDRSSTAIMRASCAPHARSATAWPTSCSTRSTMASSWPRDGPTRSRAPGSSMVGALLCLATPRRSPRDRRVLRRLVPGFATLVGAGTGCSPSASGPARGVADAAGDRLQPLPPARQTWLPAARFSVFKKRDAMMTERKRESFDLKELGRRRVEADFSAGRVSSDGGGLLLREVDGRLRLTERLAHCFRDHRRPELIEHTVQPLLAQRIYGVALGYEDLSDHERLSRDPLVAAMVGKIDVEGLCRARKTDVGKPLASPSTLGRIERTKETANEKTRYEKIVCDFDAVATLFVELYTGGRASSMRPGLW